MQADDTADDDAAADAASSLAALSRVGELLLSNGPSAGGAQAGAVLAAPSMLSSLGLVSGRRRPGGS